MTPKIKQRKSYTWYDVALPLSYNAVYNFIVTSRGKGKTYGFKKRAISQALKAGRQFIYMRRYKTELKPAMSTFFNDVHKEFPDWDFKVTGMTISASPVEERNTQKRPWKIIGYFVALSSAQTMKSVSFADVDTIIFDEFIIEKGVHHYLPSEPRVFNNFYSTVDRNQDRVQVFFLANAVTIQCPYFLEYGIRPDKLPEIGTLFKGFVLYHFPKAGEYEGEVSQSRFGRFIAGTEYEQYAVMNEFSDSHDAMIDRKPKDASFMYNFETELGTFSVWKNWDKLYALNRIVDDGQKIFTMCAEKMDTNRILVTYSDKFVSYLRTSFRKGRITFDSPQTRNAFVEIFKR